MPSTGERLECTLKTFMKTLIFSASQLRYGSRAAPTTRTRPSAGHSTRFAPSGTSRGGSRKNCRMKKYTIQNGIDHQPKNQATATATMSETVRKGRPSRATIGCGQFFMLVLIQ